MSAIAYSPVTRNVGSVDELVHFYSFGSQVITPTGELWTTLCGLLVPEGQLAQQTAELTCLACLADCTDPEETLLAGVTPSAAARVPRQLGAARAT